MSKQWYTWTVEVKVHKSWVADGFEMTAERAKDMVEGTLPYANGAETKARVLSAPDADEIAKEQGYKDAADRKRRDRDYRTGKSLTTA